MSFIERITAALSNGPLDTHSLAEILWPHETHAKAWNYQSNGGPPGWVMPLGKAINKMGLRTERRNGRTYVYPKR